MAKTIENPNSNDKSRLSLPTQVNPWPREEMPFVSFMDTDLIQRIYIKGKAPEGASRFTIYLQCGAESEPDEVAFVFDVRFTYCTRQSKIVTNHKKKGRWGTEEDGDCPFVFNHEEDFKIKIIVEDDAFRVKVNGEDFLEYEQKLSSKNINCLRIENDVQLTQVKLK